MTHPTGWPTAQRISNILEVRKAIDEFVDCAAEDNELAMISAILNASPASVRAAALEEAVRDAIAENMTGLYYCCRTWSAWSVGTMSQNDFWPAGDDSEIIQNITDGVMAALSAAPAGGLGVVDSKSDSFGAILAQFMTPKRIKDLRRFDEFTQDGEGYDIDAEDMDALADIGLIRRTSGRHFQFTDLGLMALLHYAPIAAAQGEGK